MPQVNGSWIQRPGSAHDIGIGADGAVWVIGKNAVGGGYGIYTWDGINWNGIDGGGVRIAVDPGGDPWVVNDANNIYQRTGAGWQHRPGSAHDIGIGADGAAWVIGTNPVNGGYGIYALGNGGNWVGVDGGGVRIAVDSSGAPWVVNDANNIYQRVGAGWEQRPGSAHDIGIGADGAVWVIGTNAVGGGYGIYTWNGDNWVGIDGGGENISVDPRGFPWVTNDANNIYQRANLTTVPPIAGDDELVATEALKGNQLTGTFINNQTGYVVKKTNPPAETTVDVGTNVQVTMGPDV
jgi:hypothetical protein